MPLSLIMPLPFCQKKSNHGVEKEESLISQEHPIIQLPMVLQNALSKHSNSQCAKLANQKTLTHPLISGYSPCELLHGRQIRSKLDALFPSPPHVAQGKQARDATKDQLQEKSHLISKVTYLYSVRAPCYALYYGPKCNKKPRWVPAVVTKILGSRTVNVRVQTSPCIC